MNGMDDVYEKFGEYDLNKEREILIVFDDTIADVYSIKNCEK